MNSIVKAAQLLPWSDWLALLAFVAGWAGYAHWAKQHSTRRPSVLDTTNRIRRQWMLQTTFRAARVVDGTVLQNLSSAPSFFASTTILVIGALAAVLGTTDKATELVHEIPFAARTSVLVFDIKIVLLLVIMVFAFFRFTWSVRQYSFGALMIGAAPEADQFEQQGLSREAFADKAGAVMGLAAETFNDGLRAYYFAFAVLGWFFSPLVFVLATLGVIRVLYQREFRSEMLEVLKGG